MTRFHGYPSRQILRAELRRGAFNQVTLAKPTASRKVRKAMANRLSKVQYQALMGVGSSKV